MYEKSKFYGGKPFDLIEGTGIKTKGYAGAGLYLSNTPVHDG